MPVDLKARAALAGVLLLASAAGTSPPDPNPREPSDEPDAVVVPTGAKPALDGTIDAREWEPAATRKLSNGGSVRFLMNADRLYVGVRGKAAGWSHLVILDGRRIRVLHASNALGEATYESPKDADWSLKENFRWELAGPIQPRRLPGLLEEYLKKHGWTATNNNAGLPADIEFEIDLAAMSRPETLRIVVVHSTNDVAIPLSVWPPTTKDDTANRDLMNGTPPEKAVLDPDKWGLLKFAIEGEQSAATTKPSNFDTSRPASQPPK